MTAISRLLNPEPLMNAMAEETEISSTGRSAPRESAEPRDVLMAANAERSDPGFVGTKLRTAHSPTAPAKAARVPPRKGPKLAKDALVFKEGQPIRGVKRYPAFDDLDAELRIELEKWRIRPSGPLRKYPYSIPYKSDKREFTLRTGRNSFEIFQYYFKLPFEDNENKEWSVVWDYNIGLVRITSFFKCLEYGKTTPAKVIKDNPGLDKITHSITGGSLIAQGYWMPYDAAKAVAATFCHSIRYALVPLFGPDFPDSCISPTDEAFGRMIIDQRIVRKCTEQAEAYRLEELAKGEGKGEEDRSELTDREMSTMVDSGGVPTATLTPAVSSTKAPSMSRLTTPMFDQAPTGDCKRYGGWTPINSRHPDLRALDLRVNTPEVSDDSSEYDTDHDRRGHERMGRLPSPKSILEMVPPRSMPADRMLPPPGGYLTEAVLRRLERPSGRIEQRRGGKQGTRAPSVEKVSPKTIPWKSPEDAAAFQHSQTEEEGRYPPCESPTEMHLDNGWRRARPTADAQTQVDFGSFSYKGCNEWVDITVSRKRPKFWHSGSGHASHAQGSAAVPFEALPRSHVEERLRGTDGRFTAGSVFEMPPFMTVAETKLTPAEARAARTLLRMHAQDRGLASTNEGGGADGPGGSEGRGESAGRTRKRRWSSLSWAHGSEAI